MSRTVLHLRRHSIVERLRRHGFVRNSQLSREFGVSVVTIRQDLEALEGLGLLRRTFGGAAFQSESQQDTPFDARAAVAAAAKRRIGAAAALSIGRGETVLLDSGSTTLEISRQLPSNRDVTVVTPALNVALEAAARPGVSVIVCGGACNPRTLSTVGQQVVRQLGEIYADRLFLATYGLDLQRGLAERSYEVAQVKRALMSAAREVTLVCDSSKFGAAGPVLISPLDRIGRVITDTGIPGEFQAWFSERGIVVETV